MPRTEWVSGSRAGSSRWRHAMGATLIILKLDWPLGQAGVDVAGVHLLAAFLDITRAPVGWAPFFLRCETIGQSLALR